MSLYMYNIMVTFTLSSYSTSVRMELRLHAYGLCNILVNHKSILDGYTVTNVRALETHTVKSALCIGYTCKDGVLLFDGISFLTH